jgi:hypothetical protein
MGQTVRCKVRFEADSTFAKRIISANSGEPAGKTVDRPGSVFGANICADRSNVDYEQKPGCQHVDAFSQRTLVNCRGTSISLASFIGRNFPPGVRSC